MAPRFDTILITGAAGGLGTQLRRGLAPLARRLRLADVAPIENLQPNEEALQFDLADMDACISATKGVDAIVHFGGVPVEKPWDQILNSNIRGGYHIYEGARQNGVPRIVFASSNHAVGFASLEDNINAHSPQRPDGLYGLSKCFVEDLARLYWDKFGIETAVIRIFSSFPEPKDRRMLWSWLSYDDFIRLITASLTAPRVGYTVAFGISDNTIVPVDNRFAAHLGYRPQDNSESFRHKVEAKTPIPDPNAPAVKFLGGAFVEQGHPDDGQK